MDTSGCDLHLTDLCAHCCGAVRPWEGPTRASSSSAQPLVSVCLPSCSFLSPHPNLTDPLPFLSKRPEARGSPDTYIVCVKGLSTVGATCQELALSRTLLLLLLAEIGAPGSALVAWAVWGAQRADRNRRHGLLSRKGPLFCAQSIEGMASPSTGHRSTLQVWVQTIH